MKAQLEKAISICGGQTALAKALGVRQPHVWNWLNRSNGVVPAEHCANIEKITDGSVTRYSLRPDVFGPSPSTEPSQQEAA